MHKGQQGTSLGGVQKSPARRKREAARRQREDRAAVARSGPVATRYKCICAANPGACRATEHTGA